MEQLEMRFYNLDELAQITGVKRKSKNFKRDVKNTLEKWCYRDEWKDRHGTTITHIPATPEERLQEILVRQFHVDIQVDMYLFSCFILSFDEIEGFKSMPWEEREKVFEKHYGTKVSEKTLRSWCSTLLGEELISKNSVGSYWKTEYQGKKKIRTQIQLEDIEELENAINYKKRRRELMKGIEEATQYYLKADPKITYKQASENAWHDLYSELWSEFGGCYYSCKDFRLKSWIEKGELKEVIALAKKIRNSKLEVLKAQ